MTPLKSRKQLLIAESELNRAQLAQELETMADGIHSLAARAKTISSLTLAAASLIAGLAAFRRTKSAPPAGKLPWWQTLVKAALLAGSLFSEFHRQPKS